MHRLTRSLARSTPAGIATVIALAALCYALSNTRYHGVTFDEPALHYAGDRTLYWLRHGGRAGSLDLLGPDPADFKSAFERKPAAMDPVHYPVLPGLVGAICNWLLGDLLGLVNPIDGHHLGLLLLHVIALLMYGVYAIRLLGRFGGAAAAIALALFPSAIGHSFNNAKDWPCAMYYGVFVLALANGVIEARLRDLLVAGVLLGVAFAGKMNAVFALVTLALWLPFAYVLLYRGRTLPASVVGGVLLVPYLAGAVFFVSWPWLYQGRLPDWWMHIHEYVSFMINFGVGKRPTWSAHGLRCVAFMTPPLVLACALAYVAFGSRGERRAKAVWILLLLWFGVPILRISAPRSNYYDANRHFIEYIPALSALAGAGAAWLRQQLGTVLSNAHGAWAWAASRAHQLMAGLALLGIGALAWPVLEYRPHETTYFNVFAGGLGGAQRDGLFLAQPPVDYLINGTEGDYWFRSLRLGLATARKAVSRKQPIGLCGVSLWLAEANWPEPKKPLLTAGFEEAAVVVAIPREFFCGLSTIRKLEAERPILERVERGGGLVYEVLGPKDGKSHTVVTPPSAYTQPGWYKRD